MHYLRLDGIVGMQRGCNWPHLSTSQTTAGDRRFKRVRGITNRAIQRTFEWENRRRIKKSAMFTRTTRNQQACRLRETQSVACQKRQTVGIRESLDFFLYRVRKMTLLAAEIFFFFNHRSPRGHRFPLNKPPLDFGDILELHVASRWRLT